MTSRSHRIDVTEEQLRSLYSQFQDRFEERIEFHLPEQEDKDRENLARKETQLEVQKYLTGLMEMAGKSVRSSTSNGKINMKELIMENEGKYLEPFDLTLNEEVRKSYQEWEDTTVKVAKLRQNGPGDFRTGYIESKNEYLNKIDSTINTLKERSEELSQDEHNHELAEKNDEVIKDEHFWKEMELEYKESLAGLQKTKESLPQIGSNVKKLKTLVSYIENE